MSDNESEPHTDVPEDHLVLDPMPVFADPVEENTAPDVATGAGDTADDEIDDTAGVATGGPAHGTAEAFVSSDDPEEPAEDPSTVEDPADAPVAPAALDGTPQAPEAGDAPEHGEAPACAERPDAPSASDAPSVPDAAPALDDPSAHPGPAGDADDPSAQMWASVRDRTPARADTDPGAAQAGDGARETADARDAEGTPRAAEPAITGEEVALTTAEDTSAIVGDVDSSQLETGTIEPVSTSTSRIPVIPTADAAHDRDVATPEASAQLPVGTDTDLPPQPPRDVLENRHTASGDAAAPATPPAGETPAVPADAVGTAPEPTALDETAVQRRSLVVPAAPAPDQTTSETSWHPRSDDSPASHAATTPASLDDALFEGSTLVPVVPSRTAAHLWGLFLSLVLVPVAWFALADAGARMTLAKDAPMLTGTLNFAALLELLGGLLAVLVLALLVARSSLGAHVTGALVTVLGIPWVVAPGWTARTVLPAMDWLNAWNAFGQNTAHHLQASGYSGRLLLVGVVLLLVGALSHRVRRRGRAEESLRAEVERVNPAGAHLTARARRAAARSQRNPGR